MNGRLIVVPQYPVKLRYQEWWLPRFYDYKRYFAEIEILDPRLSMSFHMAPSGQFAPVKEAIEYELLQIQMYNDLTLRRDDALLLCDLSYPGLFSNVLYHKKPPHCYAICHATSLNRYDYFTPFRSSKWRVETGHSKLYKAIFVASEYHRRRLGWDNLHVIKFPLPQIEELIETRLSVAQRHTRPFVSVARRGRQKVDSILENKFAVLTEQPILRFYQTKGKTWTDYYGFVESGKFLIVSSREETYGYQIIDALSVGTIPLAPRAFSYPELLPPQNLYEPGDVDSLLVAYNGLAKAPTLPSLWTDEFFAVTGRTMQDGRRA